MKFWNKRIRNRFSKDQDYIEVSTLKRSKLTRREFILTVLTVLSITAFTLGSSYAIFSDTKTSDNYNVIQAGNLEIVFDDNDAGIGNILNLNGAFPMSDGEGMMQEAYSFTIENLGTLLTDYTVKVLDDTGMITADGCADDLIPKDKIKVSIDGELPILLSELEANEWVIASGEILPGRTRTHTIRMWISEEAGNEILNKHYHGKILVEAQNSGVLTVSDECFTVTDGAIVAYSDSCSKDVIIPTEVNGVSVNAVGDYAFYNKGIESVYFPDTITKLGQLSFVGNNIRNVVIPNTVTSIGMGAFNGNLLSEDQAYIYRRNSDGTSDNSILVSYGGELKDITVLPSNIVVIDDYAFVASNLTSIVIPSTVTTINDAVFFNNKLTTLVLPDSVIHLGESAFENNLLTSVQLSNTLTTVSAKAFKNNKLSSIEFPASVTTIEAEAFRANSIRHLVLPNTITSIGTGSFSHNWMESVQLSSSLITIPTTAFQTNALAEIVIPNGVKTIGANAFNFNNITSLDLGTTVESISYSSFAGNRLTSLTLPSTLITLQNSAFANNYLTGTVYIPARVYNISANIFTNNPDLETVIILGKSSSAAFGYYQENPFNEVPNVIYQP